MLCSNDSEQRDEMVSAAIMNDHNVSMYDTGNVLKMRDEESAAKVADEERRSSMDDTLKNCFARLIFHLPTPGDVARAIRTSLITRCGICYFCCCCDAKD